MLIEASRERQREMVARLIHDEPLQELYTIRMRLQLAAHGRASPDADLASAREAAERATDRLREICRELRPAVLAGSDLAHAIRGHADGVNGLRHDVDITVELDATGQQCDEVRTALFGVYLNALNNALRHSGAGSIRISLHRDGGRLLLEVVDDGSGFEASHDWLALAREGHFGFLDMSEWMRMVGGDLRVESRPGAGCTITAVAPVAMDGDRGMRAWIRRATRQGDRT
jgi:signal transduction histidine kinase